MRNFDRLLQWWSEEGHQKVSYGLRVRPDGSIMKTPKAKGMGMGTLKLQPITNITDKVGRNDKCPCASGKKYKKCCINK